MTFEKIHINNNLMNKINKLQEINPAFTKAFIVNEALAHFFNTVEVEGHLHYLFQINMMSEFTEEEVDNFITEHQGIMNKLGGTEGELDGTQD